MKTNTDKLISSLTNARTIITDMEDSISDFKEMVEQCPDLVEANEEAETYIKEIMNRHTEKKTTRKRKNAKVV